MGEVRGKAWLVWYKHSTHDFQPVNRCSSQTTQDRIRVRPIEHEFVCSLSNHVVLSDLEWPWRSYAAFYNNLSIWYANSVCFTCWRKLTHSKPTLPADARSVVLTNLHCGDCHSVTSCRSVTWQWRHHGWSRWHSGWVVCLQWSSSARLQCQLQVHTLIFTDVPHSND